MKKIVLVSDNHGVLEPLQEILKKEYKADYYFHCGDCLLDENEYKPFTVVRGNNDHGFNFPLYKVIEIEKHHILLIHGHGYLFFNSFDLLIAKAEELACDIVFFGHTHTYFDKVIKGIHFINPGSCLYNRDGSNPSYAIVYIDENAISVERYNLAIYNSI